MQSKLFRMHLNPMFFWGILFFMASCGGKAPEFSKEEFDEKRWKSDPKACNNERQVAWGQLEKVKSKLLSIDEAALRKILGKPDQIELYKRNQKFYYYFIEKGGQCDGQNTSKEGKKIEVRFNALNQVSEITMVFPTDR